MKVYVIYDTKYGNTKAAAESVLAGIKEVAGFETDIGYVNEVDPEKAAGYDALVLGAPNHMARPSRAMTKFVDRLAAVKVKAKSVAVFGTYSGSARSDRAVKKLELTVKKKFPGVNLVSSGLSVRVRGIPGPVVEGELPKCVEYGRTLANLLKK